jgi:putative transposase
MKYETVERERETYPVAAMCRILGISRTGYYDWRKRPVSERALADERLKPHIREAFVEGRETYGSPRVTRVLKKRDIPVSRKRVARLMKEENLISVHFKRRFKPQTTDSAHDMPIAPNVVSQDFSATRPNEKWGSDITYIPTDEGWLYLAVVLDFFSRRVVGWATSATVDTKLTLGALTMAGLRRSVLGLTSLVHHSDRGCQYASAEYRAQLAQLGITPSMSRTGNCYDNAMVESFFHTLKAELIDRRTFKTRKEALEAIRDYLENFYNQTRMHSALNYAAPIEFERLQLAA